MNKKLIDNIKESYQKSYKEYEYRKQLNSEMNGLDKLGLMFGMYFYYDIPVFENDLIELVNKHKLNYTDDDKCRLYKMSAFINNDYNFISEKMEYKECNGKIISKRVPNKDSGEFKSNLNKFFKHFLKEHKPDGIKNIIMYKSKHWDGRDKLNIETLLKK